MIVLIEQVTENIDPLIDPVLQRQITHKGRNMYLNFGGDLIEYNPSFKLYLTCKLVNPHFKPETAAQCTIINFIVTELGLED